jgi:ParB/RepB/Spo0J family partition protein
MSENSFILQELPLEHLQSDLNQPRKELGVEGDENKLFVSMRDVGIQQPLVVKKIDENMYTIIDGHRRYICAQRLGLKAVPCRIYKKMNPGELERVRYEVQNNRRDWKPMEKAEAIAQTKAAKRFSTDREVAEYLHLAPSTVNAALKLRTQNMNYIRLMEKYDLAEAYRVAIGRLMPKVRKIKDLEPQAIILILFEKIERKVIRRALELRTLKRIFLRATANEDAIYRFLKEPTMTIAELERVTSQSATALLIDKLFTDLSQQAQRAEKIPPREKALYTELRDLLDHLTQE